jgi:hypothetical protein
VTFGTNIRGFSTDDEEEKVMFTSEGTFMNNGVMLEVCLVFKVPVEMISV